MAYDHRKAGFPSDELVVALPERAGVRERRNTDKDRSCGGRRAGLRGPARAPRPPGRETHSESDRRNVTAWAIARRRGHRVLHRAL